MRPRRPDLTAARLRAEPAGPGGAAGFRPSGGSYESTRLSWSARRPRRGRAGSPDKEPTDVLVRITSTNICGSSLHICEGRTGVEEGSTRQRPRGGRGGRGRAPSPGRGHGVRPVQRELRVLQELRERPHGGLPDHESAPAGAAYGYAGMGPTTAVKRGTSACPTGISNCLVLPEDARERGRTT